MAYHHRNGKVAAVPAASVNLHYKGSVAYTLSRNNVHLVTHDLAEIAQVKHGENTALVESLLLQWEAAR